MEKKTEDLARKILSTQKVAIFIVAYNAEKHIQSVLSRIPDWIVKQVEEIYIIDDYSSDNTIQKVKNLNWPKEFSPLNIYKTPYNQGYGGNQRLGYLYAIKKGYDIVVLLHADGQYAPEALPKILSAYYDETVDAVFGSRFIKPYNALKGGMPFYKWIGNRVLTKMQNFFLMANMVEMHSGYRSYRVSVLKKIPFQYNSTDFDFDADIIVQLHAGGYKIQEVEIQTFYGDEICHVNGLRYAWNCIKTIFKYRLMRCDMFYDPKFDFQSVKHRDYYSKAVTISGSLPHYIVNLPMKNEMKVLVLTVNEDSFYHYFFSRNVSLIENNDPFDVALAINVFDHTILPEKNLSFLFQSLKRGGALYVSTRNVTFFLMRIMLLLGHFNYGRRINANINLFTVNSLYRFISNGGFKVEKVIGFPPPFIELLSQKKFLKIIYSFFSMLSTKWPKLFAGQILLICKRIDSAQDLMGQTFND